MFFDSHEIRLLPDVVAVDDIDVSFEDIGGMENQLQEVKDNVVLPFHIYKHFNGSHKVCTSPTGVLLYGAPGTGKTLTAKAIAKECDAVFINVKASTIMDKWVGESDKLITALFSLARKLAPSVIFMDEVETVLKKRGSDNSMGGAMNSAQGVFLSEWDGLSSTNYSSSNSNSNNSGNSFSSTGPVVVLGATNRPMDLDKAFLRRMPVQIQTQVPDEEAREAILKNHLKNEINVDANLKSIAKCTEGFTGSDIRELVRVASLNRLKSIVQLPASVQKRKEGQPKQFLPPVLRALNDEDFAVALEKVGFSFEGTAKFTKDFAVEEIKHKLQEFKDSLEEAKSQLRGEGNVDEVV